MYDLLEITGFKMDLKKGFSGLLFFLCLHSTFAFGEFKKVSEIMAGIQPQVEVVEVGGESRAIEGFRVYNRNSDQPELEWEEGGFVGLNVTLEDATIVLAI